jgi:hypothetical protein
MELDGHLARGRFDRSQSRRPSAPGSRAQSPTGSDTERRRGRSPRGDRYRRRSSPVASDRSDENTVYEATHNTFWPSTGNIALLQALNDSVMPAVVAPPSRPFVVQPAPGIEFWGESCILDAESSIIDAGFEVTEFIRTNAIPNTGDPTWATWLQLQEAGPAFAETPFVVLVGTLLGQVYYGVGVAVDIHRARHGAGLALLAHAGGAQQPMVAVENIIEHCANNQNIWIPHPGCKQANRRLRKQELTRFGPRFLDPEIIEYVPSEPASPQQQAPPPPEPQVRTRGRSPSVASAAPSTSRASSTHHSEIQPTFKQANTPLFNRVWHHEGSCLREVCRSWNHNRCTPRAKLCLNRCPEGVQRAHVCNFCASPDHPQVECMFGPDTLHQRIRVPLEEESCTERELQESYSRHRSRRPRSGSAPPPPPRHPPYQVPPAGYQTQTFGGSAGSGTR